MLKLLLSHWQSHREPLPFVLTDDPLYCSHLTKSPFPEVYSVNRVNPIFEEDDRASLKRSISETRASDDTGYSSSGLYKGRADSLTDDVVSRHMSSDSDDSSHPEAVVVSVDVHRESSPDDVIVLTPTPSSGSPYDSLTSMSGSSEVREKLQRLLQKGNSSEDPRQDLMKSLTRALNSKASVTRTDSTVDVRLDSSEARHPATGRDSTDSRHPATGRDSSDARPSRRDSGALETAAAEPPSRRDSDSSTTAAKTLYFTGVTRQDESSASSTSAGYTKPRKKDSKSSGSHQESDSKKSLSTSKKSSDSKTSSSHKCKVCENAHRPLAFHQLLPGHWSYDNVYLPQIAGVCYACMHNLQPPSSDDDVFFPMYYPHPRARHSWAPATSEPKRKREDTTTRHPPDGETDSDSNPLQRGERRSLREPKKCKCEHCLASALDACPCHCLSHARRVKFASDLDISKQPPPHHRHIHSAPFRLEAGSKLAKGEPINAAFVMNLPHLNGHALSNGVKENGLNSKMAPPLVPRGMKEPIKMDELYRSYPISFREWEAQYRRNYLQKRRKRALNMIAMAIGIVLVVGIAVALTFVLLRIKRTG